MNTSPNFSEAALDLILGDRNEAYGNPREDFEGIALMWTGLINAKLHHEITAEDVARMMVALKLRRDSHRQKDDNLIDAHGYLHCLSWIQKGLRPRRGDES